MGFLERPGEKARWAAVLCVGPILSAPFCWQKGEKGFSWKDKSSAAMSPCRASVQLGVWSTRQGGGPRARGRWVGVVAGMAGVGEQLGHVPSGGVTWELKGEGRKPVL